MGYVEDKLAHLAATIALEGDRTREAFAAGLAETKEGLRVTGARYVPIRPKVTSAAGRLVGWSLYSATDAAVITFHDGQTVDDDVIAVVTIAPGGSATVPLPGAGVSFVHGLFAEIDSAGAVTGAVWLGAVD